mgnify:FL=1
MEKDQIKEILEKHMEMLSKISNEKEYLMTNPLTFYLLTESLKTTSLTLLFLSRI